MFDLFTIIVFSFFVFEAVRMAKNNVAVMLNSLLGAVSGFVLASIVSKILDELFALGLNDIEIFYRLPGLFFLFFTSTLFIHFLILKDR